MLLDLTADATVAGAGSWSDLVDVVTARPGPEPAGVTALLLRPDSFVAWATDTPVPDATELSALRDAVARWFG